MLQIADPSCDWVNLKCHSMFAYAFENFEESGTVFFPFSIERWIKITAYECMKSWQ
jgi:hypothetical protein